MKPRLGDGPLRQAGALLLGVFAAATAMAAGRGAAAAAPRAADMRRGAALATQGLPQKAVPACAGCHGAGGEGMAAAGFPRLAAQSADYLERQMRSFADGSRPHPVMSPIAKALDARETRAVSSHYAALPPPPAAAASGPAEAASAAPDAARGRQLASVGDDGPQVQACANCHGPGGDGEPPAVPYLAGQHAGYLATALGAWKSGQRKNDPSGQMPAIAARLSDADIAAVAGYYAALAPAVPRPKATPAKPPQASAKGHGAKAPAAQGRGSQGIGTESGSPLTGGSQGPGGGGGTRGTDPTKKVSP